MVILALLELSIVKIKYESYYKDKSLLFKYIKTKKVKKFLPGIFQLLRHLRNIKGIVSLHIL